MTVTLCILFAIALSLLIVGTSREVSGLTPVRLNWGLLALAVLLILVALFTRGIWYQAGLYLGDIWTAQDALHKTAAGQRSSLDYFNPIGPVFQWVLAATLLIQTPSTSSLVLANVMVAVTALLATISLLKGRATSLTVAIVALIAVTTALSPRDIDTLITAPQSSMLAPYNRWGWALLTPLAMRAALPGGRIDVIGSVLSGLLIALLVLLKVTYGAAALGIFAVVLVLHPTRWREVGVVFAATALALFILDVVTGGQVRAYFGDLAVSGQMPSNGVRIVKFVNQSPVFFAFAAGCLLLMRVGGRRRSAVSARQWLANWRTYLIALAVGASGLVVLMQNHYSTEAVTLLLMPLIVAEREGILAELGGHRFGFWDTNPNWVGVIMLVTLAFPVVDAGFIFAQKVKTQQLRALAAPFEGTGLSGLVVDEAYQPSPAYQCVFKTCNDMRRTITGRDLIAQYCPNHVSEAILAFDFSNPFPAFLNSPSPRHAPIWLHTDRSFSRDQHVPGDKLFSDVGCVIIAKGDPVAAALLDIYGDDLRRGYRPVAENDDWSLWQRGGAAR